MAARFVKNQLQLLNGRCGQVIQIEDAAFNQAFRDLGADTLHLLQIVRVGTSPDLFCSQISRDDPDGVKIPLLATKQSDDLMIARRPNAEFGCATLASKNLGCTLVRMKTDLVDIPAITPANPGKVLIFIQNELVGEASVTTDFGKQRHLPILIKITKLQGVNIIVGKNMDNLDSGIFRRGIIIEFVTPCTADHL